MAVDQAAVARLQTAFSTDSDATTIAVAMKTATSPVLDLPAIATAIRQMSPWTANGSNRWKHARGVAQLLAGTPGTRLCEMTDMGDGTVTLMLYTPAANPDPANNLNGPLDGMTCSDIKAGVAKPNTVAAAYAILEAAVSAGHL